ncbi:unnamed protein product [Parnassius apollo]|uniref:(apollo) hypothetical protein n=1 Tax=Parnassius apollo TaxID=110799 RepID=A0A8S3X3J2_PARAO|nr:unnamed protein product [Parnassius apollo]
MLVVLVIAVQSTPLGPGPQTLTKNIPVNQNPQKRELILYLTPSQIKALQEGKGYINYQLINQAETSEENQEESEQTQQEQEELFQLRSLEEDSEALEEENNEEPSLIPVEEPNSEEVEEWPQLTWVYRSPQNRNLLPISVDNLTDLRLTSEPEEQIEENQTETEEDEEETENDQPESQPESQSEAQSETQSETQSEAQSEAPRQQVFRLVAYESATEKSISTTTKPPQEEPIEERWLRLWELNRSQLRKASLPQNNVAIIAEQPQDDPETNLPEFRFLVRNNNQKQAVRNQDKRRKNLLQKQKVLIQAEARAQNAPTQSRKEFTNIKQNQARLIQITKPSFIQVTKTAKEGPLKLASEAPSECSKHVSSKKTSVPAKKDIRNKAPWTRLS